MKDTLSRREAALRSLDSEVTDQKEKIDGLSKSLDRQQKLGRTGGRELRHIEMIQNLVRETKGTKGKLDTCLAEKSELISELEKSREALSRCEMNYANAKKELALIHSQLSAD